MPCTRDHFSERKLTGESLPRREFFKRASLAAVGAAVGLGAGRSLARAAEPLNVNGLPAVEFGKTGLKVTRISFGGMLITEPSVLTRVIDQGINMVHTAPGYTNGRSMEAFGKVMKTHRKKVVLALKALPSELDDCLPILNTDYVDILVPPIVTVEGINDPSIPESFAKVKKAGKAGFMGFACHSKMTEVLNAARVNGNFQATLVSYAQGDNPEFVAAAKAASEAGIGIMTMKGLDKRVTRTEQPDIELGNALCSAMVNERHAHTVLASMSNFQTVDMFREILEKRLSYANPALEERYWAERQGAYCSMCGKCTEVCPAAENIPRIMRYRMYHQDYGLADYARSKYAALKLDSGALTSQELELCESVCTRRLPLKEMLAEAHSLLA